MMRSQEILDSVENGESFAVVRDGRVIGELIPTSPRRLVSREDFIRTSARVPDVDLTEFREELAAEIDQELGDLRL